MLNAMPTVELVIPTWSIYDYFPFTDGKMRLRKFKTHVNGPQPASDKADILTRLGKVQISSRIKFG